MAEIELNTGFETSQSGISRISKIALNTNTGGLADDSGILKRKVLEPDEFPRIGLDLTSPPNLHAATNPKYQDRASKSK